MTQPKLQSADVTEVGIVGAGPYGLSIASFLAARDIPFRIFGNAMSAWANQMPKGMRLKSEGFASSLADPRAEFTLAEYCRQEGVPYQDVDRPVPLETFVAYGLAFQKKFVSRLENKLVVRVRPAPVGFELRLEDGEMVFARKVIIAVGITHFAHVPAVLSAIPTDFVSHSSAHSDLQRFRTRQVAVIGAGASALDLAALLHQAGASVQVIARCSVIRFHNPPRPRSLAERIFRPTTGIGMGLDYCFYVTVPHIFRWLPEKIRLSRLRKSLGPAPGWFIRDEVVGKIPMCLNTNISRAWVENGRVSLQLTDGERSQERRVREASAACPGRRPSSSSTANGFILGGTRRSTNSRTSGPPGAGRSPGRQWHGYGRCSNRRAFQRRTGDLHEERPEADAGFRPASPRSQAGTMP